MWLFFNRNICTAENARWRYTPATRREFRMTEKTLRWLVPLLVMPAALAGAPMTCSDARHREFDFWAGNWRVHGANQVLAGESAVTIEEGGCVLVERWRSAKGGTGQSLNYFDPVAGKWKQRWVGLGLILEMQGGMQGSSMVLEGPLHYVQPQRTTLLRGTWSLLPDGRVRQHFVESADAGKTWAEWFDGYYSNQQGGKNPR
jgi:hypothetical protein